MSEYLTIDQVASILQISKWTIYSNGPAQYGGVKIGRLWRFPAENIGQAPTAKKTEKVSNVYQRRFPAKKGVN